MHISKANILQTSNSTIVIMMLEGQLNSEAARQVDSKNDKQIDRHF